MADAGFAPAEPVADKPEVEAPAVDDAGTTNTTEEEKPADDAAAAPAAEGDDKANDEDKPSTGDANMNGDDDKDKDKEAKTDDDAAMPDADDAAAPKKEEEGDDAEKEEKKEEEKIEVEKEETADTTVTEKEEEEDKTDSKKEEAEADAEDKKMEDVEDKKMEDASSNNGDAAAEEDKEKSHAAAAQDPPTKVDLDTKEGADADVNMEVDLDCVKADTDTPTPDTPAAGENKRPAEDTPTGATPSSDGGTRGKRVRKSVDTFDPTAFQKETLGGSKISRASVEGLEQIKVPDGRGQVLGDIGVVKESIEGHAEKDAELLTVAHRVLFGGRGKFMIVRHPKKKEAMTHSILQFSGFLSPTEDQTEDELKLKKQDEHEQKKFEDRLHKWPKDTLVDLCHFFAVDSAATKGSPPQNKGDFVTKLIKFLGSPSEELVTEKVIFRRRLQGSAKKPVRKSTTPVSKKKVAKRSKSSSAKKGKVTPGRGKKKSLYKEWDTDEEEEESSEEESSEEEESEEEQLLPKKKAKGKDGTRKFSGKMPSDKDIKEWVEHYVGCFNLNKVTTNHALTTAGDKFQCEMSPKKPMIKELLKDAIFDQM